MDETPTQRLARFVAKFDPPIAKLVRAARAKLLRRMPAAVQLVYENFNALAIGFGPSERASEVIVSLAVYARGVNLYFMHGAKLTDPNKVLQGGGKEGRFIRLASARDLDNAVVRELLDAAIARTKAPLPTGRKGYLVIKSVSARQRSRRPG